MELPEVRELVDRYLSPHDLTSCVRVCKEWKASFIPFIYHTFNCSENFNERYSANPTRFPSAGTLEKYSRYVVALVITPSSWFLNILMISCENLKRLSIELLGEDNSEHWPKIARLVGNNPRLESVKLASLPDLLEIDPRFLADLNVQSSQLKRLELQAVILDVEGLESLRSLCSKGLSHLDLQVCSIKTRPDELDSFIWPEFPSMHFLHLALAAGTTLKRSKQLEWFQKCPNLEHMGWESFELLDMPPFPCDEFERFLDAEDSPSRSICSLVLAQGAISESAVGEILNRCRRSLVKFQITGADSFYLSTFIALSRHFETLQVLDFHTHEICTVLTQMVMERCPRLVKMTCDMSAKHFYRGVISENDSRPVVDNGAQLELLLEAVARLQVPAKIPSRPWVCKGLRELMCCIDCSDEMRENRQVIYQLSKMKALNSACFRGCFNVAGHYLWFSPDFTEDMDEDTLAKVDLPSTPTYPGSLLSRYLAENIEEQDHAISKVALSIWPRLDSIFFIPHRMSP